MCMWINYYLSRIFSQICLSDPSVMIMFMDLMRSAWSSCWSSWQSCRCSSVMCLVMWWGAKCRNDQRYCPKHGGCVIIIIFLNKQNHWLKPEEKLSQFYVIISEVVEWWWWWWWWRTLLKNEVSYSPTPSAAFVGLSIQHLVERTAGFWSETVKWAIRLSRLLVGASLYKLFVR